MLEGLAYLFSRRPALHIVRDVVDILVVAYLIYRALLVLRGTRAQQMSIGLLIIAGIYLGARWIGLVTLVNLLNTLLSSAVLILVVVFQNDIRRGLMRMGDRTWFTGLSRAQETRVIDEVVEAATELARHRMGAIIAFEQNATLDEFVVGHGIQVDAAITSELLVTIFQPESVNKLHDGAVIIRNLRLHRAGVFFPMPEAKNIEATFGSRHRAAIGVTEETDAVVVVVSEERGAVTVCFRGNMIPNLDEQRLRAVLLDLTGHKPRKPAAPQPRRDGDPPRSPQQGESNRPPALKATPVSEEPR